MKAKLISSGLGYGTKVLTESGEELKGITRIRWEVAVDEIATMEVDLLAVTTEVEGRLLVRVPHPVDGDIREVARIVFADGSEWAA